MSVLLVVGSGCGIDAKVKKAEAIKLSIQGSTAKIDTAIDTAWTKIVRADGKVAAAATQPSTPAELKTTLAGVHEDLTGAKLDLAPVKTETAKINGKATEAATVTTEAVNDLKKERDSFWSFKQRTLFYVLAALLVPFVILLILVKTLGGGPVLSAFGEIFGSVLSAVWTVIRTLAKGLLHLITGGTLHLTNVANRKWSDQQRSIAVNSTPKKA